MIEHHVSAQSIGINPENLKIGSSSSPSDMLQHPPRFQSLHNVEGYDVSRSSPSTGTSYTPETLSPASSYKNSIPSAGLQPPTVNSAPTSARPGSRRTTQGQDPTSRHPWEVVQDRLHTKRLLRMVLDRMSHLPFVTSSYQLHQMAQPSLMNREHCPKILSR